jgi:hypothetical protein
MRIVGAACNVVLGAEAMPEDPASYGVLLEITIGAAFQESVRMRK